MDEVECPYCGYSNDMDSALDDGIGDDSTIDWECQHCEEEFEVYVEFNPCYSATKIEYVKCDLCKQTIRDNYKTCNKRGSTAPYPSNIKYNILCNHCYGKEYLK